MINSQDSWKWTGDLYKNDGLAGPFYASMHFPLLEVMGVGGGGANKSQKKTPEKEGLDD